MPRFDGTGPEGKGPKTGRGLGNRGRPRRMRKVGEFPNCQRFGPKGYPTNQIINMIVEEYETIRLIDEQGLNQEETASKMNIGRTTVQSIYATARKKIADALVNQKEIFIDGGNYQIRKD